MYTVYKTINLLNSRFYIGVHKTENPNDSYLGSGIVILNAIKKYGKNKFSKEILYIFETSTEAYNKEKDLIKLVENDSNCMNISKGGYGGWSWDKNKKQITAKDSNSKYYRVYTDDERLSTGELLFIMQGHKHTIETRLKMSKSKRGISVPDDKRNKKGFYKHTESTKVSISESKKGNKSLTGRSWYNNGNRNFALFGNEQIIIDLKLAKGKINKKARKSGYHVKEDFKITASKMAKGKKWYNDGNKTYFLFPSDQKITDLQLVLGRSLL